jgi:hypothetical protein
MRNSVIEEPSGSTIIQGVLQDNHKFGHLMVMIGRLLHLFTWRVYRAKMAAWTAKVDQIVREPPGTDDGFSPEDIARSARVVFTKLSAWEIVCEEVLDTMHPRVYYERARQELRQRGISDEEYGRMRRFAWLTAGWLNFEKMLWEWCSLNEKDIYQAIRWQFQEGWISRAERDRLLAFAKRYDAPDCSANTCGGAFSSDN